MKRLSLFVLLATVLIFSTACGGSTPAPATQAPAPATQTLAPITQAPVPATQASVPPILAVQPTTAPAQVPIPTQTNAAPSATATNLPMPDSVLKLVNSPWQWVKSTDNSGQVITVAKPAQYIVQFFLADGQVAVKADCHNAAGSFTADAHNLTISLGPVTMEACSPGSLSDQFVKGLGEVQSYLFDGDNLIMAWKANSGNMRFTQAASSVVKPTTAAKPRATSTVQVKPATTLDFKVELVGCRNNPTTEKPGGIVLVFRFVPTGGTAPYHYFDTDAGQEVPQIYERPASKGSGVIVNWAVQSADGQRLEKKTNYAASTFSPFGCP